jgi:hypothetical protein
MGATAHNSFILKRIAHLRLRNDREYSKETWNGKKEEIGSCPRSSNS